MHICDKCRKYNKCYPNGISKMDELLQREVAEEHGCFEYKELTVEAMFGLKDGILNK